MSEVLSEVDWYNLRMKHMEFLQSAIARMSNNSAQNKNFCLTLAGGFIGLAAALESPDLMAFSIPLLLALAFLDANYLRLERSFRDKYDSVRKSTFAEKPDFSMSTGWKTGSSLWSTFFSWSVLGFYGPIIAVILIVQILFTVII